jgi:uncharacterized membrane protein
MAVIITIMAFNVRQPGGARFSDLGSIVPSLLVYALSFTFVGIYWNNHHHLLRSTERISGAVMWCNLHLLFWISLIPSVTAWMAKYYKDSAPASVYGIVGLGAAVAYGVLVSYLIRCNGTESPLARSLSGDVKGRVSIVLYAVGVGLAWITPWLAYGVYASISIMWFVPDRRLDQ